MKRPVKKLGLPHKKIAISAVAGLAVLVVLYFVFGNTKTVFETEDLDQAKSFEDVALNDSDGDGLADWEELLAGLNPYDIDTDGDGYGDYETIMAARMILAQPDDDPVAGPDFVPSSGTSGDLSETEAIGRQLYGLIEVLKTSGELTPQKQQNVTGALIADAQTLPRYRNYTLLEVNLTNELGNGDDLVYLQNMLDLFENYQYLSPNPLATLDESITREDPLFVENGLMLVVENQTTTRNALLSMAVFPQYMTQHLEILNLVERVLVNTKQIQMFHQDPLRNYIAITEFVNHSTALTEALADFTQTVNETIAFYRDTTGSQ